MYEAYFGFQKRPFSATPDAGCFFAPELIRKTYDDLRLRAELGQGIVVLTAVAGTGKTLLCRRLSVDLADRLSPIFLANANFATRKDLLQAIHFELGRRYGGLEEQELRLELIAALRGMVNDGRGALLIVDEAHLLSDRLLEEIRALSCQTEGDQPLVRVVLAGQMGLEMRLIEPSLEALNQRIVCHGYLEPLTRAESRDYVAFRLEWAGADVSSVFLPEALDAIAEACNGLPRCLNQLCDHSLLLSYVQDVPVVTAAIVAEALGDLRQLPLHWNESLTAATDPVDSDLQQAIDNSPDEWEDAIGMEAESLPRIHEEPTTAIEVGGDPEPGRSENDVADSGVSVPWKTVTATNPLPPLGVVSGSLIVLPSVGGRRVFEEEAVIDRYAQLDQQGARGSRTFDGAALPARHSLSSRSEHAPLASKPDVPRVDLPERSTQAETPIEAPELDQRFAATHRVPLENSPAATPPAARLPEDRMLQDVLEVEEEIGSSVLEACLEVQDQLGKWWDAPPARSTVDELLDVIEPDECGTVAGLQGRYDVVEPDPRPERDQRAVNESTPPRDERAPVPRYIPKPNYRLVFSKLRRRLGRM
jgi:type II secretory pathway predicted ATPase ExeA